MEPWPFEDPRNVAVFTLRQIVFGGAPILTVYHDEDDGCWQFLTGLNGEAPSVEDAAIVGLGEMVEMDPTIRELADLPTGWCAWRPSPEEPWRRKRRPTDFDAGT